MKLTSKLKYFALTCGLVAGFASCNNDDDIKNTGTNITDDGDPTSLTISISQPRSSYAQANDPNATVDEAKLETVDVYIYNSIGNLITYETLSSSDFSSPVHDGSSKDQYTADVTIATTTGDRKIYVGVNLPSRIASSIDAIGNLSGLNNVYTITSSDIAGGSTGTDGFAMFCTEETQITLGLDETQNKVSIDVARLSAKVSVHEGTALDLTQEVAGGLFSDLKFTIGNSNTKIYAFQQLNGTTVIDPNYQWTTSNNYDSDFVFLGNYVAVNPYTVSDIDDLNVKYTPENTSQYYYERETTYASVQASFVPSYHFDGTDDVANTGSTVQTFWAVKLTDGSIKYFNDESIAQAYQTDNSGSVLNEYTDGQCYYTMFLNSKNKFNTIRNTYYKAVITSINGLGSHAPDVTDPTEPITESTTLTVDINVLDWVVEEDEYELSL